LERAASGRRRATASERLALKTRQLRAVGEISAALAAAWELETTLDVITRITSEVMGVASCSIYLTEKSADRLVLKATTGLARAAIGKASLRSGEGLTGWTVTHGRPVAATDARLDARFKLLPETHEESLSSLLAVPLTVQGRTIGAMNVQTAQPHQYADEEIELLSLIANLAAGAIEKATLYDHMRQQIHELEGLVTVSRAIISPLYLDEMLAVVAEMAARVMGAKAVILHLLDEASGRLAVRAAHNVDLENRTVRSLALGEGIVGEVARQAKPLVVPDVRSDPRYRDRDLAESEGLVSLLSVPLIVRERTVGVLSCYTDIRHDFGPKEIDVFSMLANQTALAIENARLVIGSVVVREMHHRIKNNLQTVAMLLRLEMGAAEDGRTKTILGDALTRILSIAAVHETLSEQGLELVDVRQMLERVARNVVGLAAGKEITIEVLGEPLSLPSRAATSLALTATELVQNAVKHAFVQRDRGTITISISTGRDACEVVVADDGMGDAAERPVRRGLGYEIVQTLVTHDLKGHVTIESTSAGTRAVVRFPTAAAGGAAS
jgi:signal transduction protein with GAF and PtsI domain/anti-sigma regulatory factor (Ser/Thr protein kinase)